MQGNFLQPAWWVQTRPECLQCNAVSNRKETIRNHNESHTLGNPCPSCAILCSWNGLADMQSRMICPPPQVVRKEIAEQERLEILQDKHTCRNVSECRFTAFYTHGALIFVPVAWKLESACRLQWRFGQISQDFRQSGSQTHSACAILCHSVPGRCSLDQTSEAQVGIHQYPSHGSHGPTQSMS